MMKRIVLIMVMLAVVSALAEGQTGFTVMSYNIRNSWANDGENAWGKRKEATIRMIREVKPDVIGMQEVCLDQEAYMDSALGGYGHIGVCRDDGRREGEIMAVFYDTARVELREWGTFWLSETPNEPSRGWDAACKRTCTWAVMVRRETGERFLMMNTHLDHVGRVAREMEVRMIADSVRVMRERMGVERVVLTGDFNTTARNRIFEPLKREMSEAREVSEVTDRGYTYNGFGKVDPGRETHVLDENGNTDNEVAIDHVFVRGMRVRRLEVMRGDYGVRFVSDHFPVVAVFE